MNTKNVRDAGILLHITSLPSAYGIGDLGKDAYAVADWMAEAGVTLWQLLPLGPTGYGNSPYAPRSTFAGNELLVSLDELMHQGFLTTEDCLEHPVFPKDHVDYDMVQRYKLPLLKKAARNFLEEGGANERAYTQFCKEQRFWLEDYALFMALYEQEMDGRWFSHWPKAYAKRESNALRSFLSEKKLEVETWKVLQFFFELQWKAFKLYVNSKQIKLIGDVPIFVASDSADTWSNLHLFKIDKEGRFSAVSGVPPDIFSSTGQLWGNPVYDWKVLKQEGYGWWLKRLERLFAMTDILRIDHFRGFDAYYEIPSGDTTAENGSWVAVDGADFFKAVHTRFGSVAIIAEDLGLMTESVEKLRDENHFPGMKILQFGFSRNENGEPNYHDDFLPHNWDENFVAYTGTHDNNTTLGWFRSLDAQDKEMVLSYLDCNKETVVWTMIRTLLMSHARTAVVPMQDILEKDEKARMNYPSSCNEYNWSWRLIPDELDDSLAKRLSRLITISGRKADTALLDTIALG